MNVLRSRTDLSQFVQMIDNSSTINALIRGDGTKYTILAPTNDGLDRGLNDDDRLALRNDAIKRDQFIKRHIIAGRMIVYE